MKIIFYLGHPAHFHLFRFVIMSLKKKGHQICILIKKKEMLEDLLKNQGWSYKNILPKGRKDNILSISFGLLEREFSFYKIARKFSPNLMLGTSAEIAHIGKLLNIPSIVVGEDDWDVIPLFARITYPFANHILVPESCRMGKWDKKSIVYNGYQELTYLHHDYFSPDPQKAQPISDSNHKNFILRFVNLGAHHDKGRKGITTSITEKLIQILKPHGKIFITSERKLENQFEKYRININPLNIHHAMYFSDIVIGDSQTMIAEAAVLGVPSLRFNDFVGEIGYLEELENRYALTYGIKTTEPEKLFDKVNQLLKIQDLKSEWKNRRQKMFDEKINVTSFFVWLIENYPQSVDILKKNPDYQYNFK